MEFDGGFPEDHINMIEDGVYLGDIDGALDIPLLQSLNIKNILSLIEDFSMLPNYPNINHKRVQIVDNSRSNLISILPECINFISSAQKRKENTFVHCAAGISRSPSVLIAYFMVKYSDSYIAARQYVNKGRPGIWPNEGFVSQLQILNVNQYKRYLV